MALIDDVKDIIDELAPHGWKELFERHGLDISATDFRGEIKRDLSDTIDRSFPGFEDFAMEGTSGIDAGKPALSLLYHALASPNVLWSDLNKTEEIAVFPSFEQLNIVENFIYAESRLSLRRIESIHGRSNIAIVIFANQYRTAIDTPHKKHADLVYCRTGVARVGNAASEYNPKTRSFNPLSPKSEEIRVLPAKYDAYLAIQKKGSEGILGHRFNKRPVVSPFTSIPSDENLDFWYPIHKLFDGDECLAGLNITLDYQAFHSNEKIARIHQFVSSNFNEDPGSNPTERKSFPYSFSEGIARFDTNLVVPETHEALVSKAMTGDFHHTLKKEFSIPFNGRRFELDRTGNTIAQFFSSMEFRSSDQKSPFSGAGNFSPRLVPEYAHVRTKIENGNETDLNLVVDNEQHIAQNQFEALHYVDFTGDGFVTVNTDVPELNSLKKVNAYSIVSPPDFFPFCEQTEIIDALELRSVWSTQPNTLADMRIHPNIQTHSELFFEGISATDTCTALLSGSDTTNAHQTNFEPKAELRVTYLTDGAAGVFAPGWDTSFDLLSNGMVNIPHLAAYGLGSPFPEDAKLCAALSSFWPAVAPDISRSFWPTFSTVLPLTDEEIGSVNGVGWDGEHGPTISSENGRTLVTYKKIEYVDYTLNALNNKFDYTRLANIDSKEYINRVEKLDDAKQRVARGADLISYSQIGSGDQRIHKFLFMERSLEISSTRDTITLEALRLTEIVLDASGNLV